MSKLQTVEIKAHTDVYGQQCFTIVEAKTGHLVRGDIGRYETAIEIAKRIDSRNLDPEAMGWGGLELS